MKHVVEVFRPSVWVTSTKQGINVYLVITNKNGYVSQVHVYTPSLTYNQKLIKITKRARCPKFFITSKCTNFIKYR